LVGYSACATIRNRPGWAARAGLDAVVGDAAGISFAES
jgi:hypothetical protein